MGLSITLRPDQWHIFGVSLPGNKLFVPSRVECEEDEALTGKALDGIGETVLCQFSMIATIQ
jgi:hypothetical protein